MPNQVKPVMMFLILDFIHRRMQEDKARKLLVIDEAWSLLRYGEQATYLFEIIKTARKYGLGMVIITQEANDLLFSKAGRIIPANTAWKLLLRQEPVVMKELSERFNLNQEEQNFILTAQKGEGLLFAMNDRIPITVVASKKEYEIITTNPDEIHAKDKARKEFEQKIGEEQSLKQDTFKLEKNLYLADCLSVNEERYLRENNFKKVKFANLEGKNQAVYLKNPPSNQSPAHYFLAELIAEELRQRFGTVKVDNTVGADLEFTNNGTKYALEVQTEHDIQKDKTKLGIKIANLEKQYGKNWVFVVTQAITKQDYEKYGPTITRTEVKEWIQKIK